MKGMQQPMTRAALVFLVGVVALTACSTNAPVYAPPDPQAERMLVAIRPFRTDLAPPEYEGPTDFGQILAEYVAGALQEQGVPALVTPIGSELPPRADFEVVGDVLHLDPGSWNLRFWIGFGAGRALVAADARLLRTGARDEVVANSHLRARSNTWQGQENILRRTCARVARTMATELREAIVMERRRGRY